MHLRIAGFLTTLILFLTGCQTEKATEKTQLTTFCNPVDISYRFCLDEPSRREAADPTIAWFKDRYFLFASKSEGYWHSQNLVNWEFIETNQIPTEEYAPTVVVINDTLYFLASSTEKSTVFKSFDPRSGNWKIAREELEIPVWDPALFLDSDNRLYMYWGCSNENPLYGIELDYKNNFTFIGKPTALKYPNPEKMGWEVPGDYNTLVNQRPWIEGSWVNKYNGKYYLQYSGPGTEYKSYADGAYVSDSPLGPFNAQPNNPFAYKPEGFAAGAGHGSTFADQYGNYWHIGTMTISKKHMFERRLGLFPAFFDEAGTLFATTKYGDYPLNMPQKKIESIEEIFPNWNLLSYNKGAEASSSLDSFPTINMTDENIRTYWAAESGSKGEFATLDLGKSCDVNAIQINFAEHNTKLFGRVKDTYHKYVIEYSNDKSNWQILVDRSNNQNDNTHVYLQLDDKIKCRYLKITNIEVPDGHFAISGFRAFGNGNGLLPEKIGWLTAKRNPEDKRSVYLEWEKSDNAVGYNISYGLDSTKQYLNYQVYQDTSLIINSLNADLEYYFSIEAFNENGVKTNKLVFVSE